MRLIDADALWMDVIHSMDYCDDILEFIERQPTIEPERKKGTWIPFDIPWYRCSECGAVRKNASFMENFCPSCGADMRGEQDE